MGYRFPQPYSLPMISTQLDSGTPAFLSPSSVARISADPPSLTCEQSVSRKYLKVRSAPNPCRILRRVSRTSNRCCLCAVALPRTAEAELKAWLCVSRDLGDPTLDRCGE